MKTEYMYKNTSKERLIRFKDSKTGIQRLDAYIKNYETTYKTIPARRDLSRRQTRLLKYTDRLIEAIEKEEIKKNKALENLKASNEAMQETISKLQDSAKTYRESVRAEFKKFDTLNTERLLNIDPRNISTNITGNLT